VALAALFVALIPTTIGGLLSAIGIAGMDRLVRFNVIATSGRAVEAAGDVDVLLLDKTGTITLGDRHGRRLHPGAGRHRAAIWPRRRSLLRLPTTRRRAVRSSSWPNNVSTCAAARSAPTHAKFVPFTAQTRMSGVDIDGVSIRKGAVDAVLAFVSARMAARVCLATCAAHRRRSPARAARRWPSPMAKCWALCI
jgi:K+-transporting ATPase ATPase B chain